MSTLPPAGPRTRSRFTAPPPEESGSTQDAVNALALSVPLPEDDENQARPTEGPKQSILSPQPPITTSGPAGAHTPNGPIPTSPSQHPSPLASSPPHRGHDTAAPSLTPDDDLIELRMLESPERLSTQATPPPPPAQSIVSTSTPETTTRERAKLAREPDPFSGDRTKLEGFLATTRLYFMAYPSSFPTDQAKITFILTNLRGPVLASFQPYICQDPQPFLLQDYHTFISHLERNWGTADAKGHALAR
ncbi:hypothetical protein B9479_005001 [Cryptococcus floricola]|uniref:DUF4939 domain-containing protein n=1 Tax=Cryptococcus floricola TaxID=2591691 RepID=A0A5D3AWU7_9TREE|nr:hypothetical protein B9479_005001 [Cryptococcus floricola]